MKINLNRAEAQIREKRLKSIVSYNGSANDLCEKSAKGCLSCKEGSFSQCGECSAQRTIIQVSAIRDAAVINHGPVGCAADFANWNKANRAGLASRGYAVESIKSLSSNLQEKDTVYGGGVKLKKAIKEAYKRFNPKAIFIMTSCVSGIIGDDIESIA